MTACEVSVIIPARNEEGLIAETVRHVVEACEEFQRSTSARTDNFRTSGLRTDGQLPWEILVVDNHSSDNTIGSLEAFIQEPEVRVIECAELGAAKARNLGRRQASGRVLIFVDADTMISRDTIIRLVQHCDDVVFRAGITWLGNYDGGLRSRLWWLFWNCVRCLPMARAKAMPAVMFCTSETFDRFGPFEEGIAIGEEWPILAGLYRIYPEHVIYDKSLVARSSSRRMDRQPFGYSRTLFRYVWAILHRSGRIHYTDQIR